MSKTHPKPTKQKESSYESIEEDEPEVQLPPKTSFEKLNIVAQKIYIMKQTFKSRHSKKRKSTLIALIEDELEELHKDVEQVILDSIINQVPIEQKFEKKLSKEDECQKVKSPTKNLKV